MTPTTPHCPSRRTRSLNLSNRHMRARWSAWYHFENTKVVCTLTFVGIEGVQDFRWPAPWVSVCLRQWQQLKTLSLSSNTPISTTLDNIIKNRLKMMLKTSIVLALASTSAAFAPQLSQPARYVESSDSRWEEMAEKPSLTWYPSLSFFVLVYVRFTVLM